MGLGTDPSIDSEFGTPFVSIDTQLLDPRQLDCIAGVSDDEGHVNVVRQGNVCGI